MGWGSRTVCENDDKWPSQRPRKETLFQKISYLKYWYPRLICVLQTLWGLKRPKIVIVSGWTLVSNWTFDFYFCWFRHGSRWLQQKRKRKWKTRKTSESTEDGVSYCVFDKSTKLLCCYFYLSAISATLIVSGAGNIFEFCSEWRIKMTWPLFFLNLVWSTIEIPSNQQDRWRRNLYVREGHSHF